ncbi:actin-like ATPase domain-containing protein, partial [Ramicandelaber brevisporus]
MLPTYISHLPTGDEAGDALGVEIDAQRIRIGLVRLSYPLPEDVATSNVSRLLDFVAHCLVDALDRFHLWNKPRIPLAVILCFALEQTSLSRARIIGISKTFDVEGVMGNDIGDLLRSALSAKGLLSIDVVAILNDTAATVLAHAYPVPQTQIGVILSNGINLAYMDKLGAEKTLVAGFGAGAGTKLQQQQQDEATLRPMIINTEVGGYSPFHRIVPTEADLAIESDTGFDGRQRLEKCVGGIYLGELVRYTLIDLAEQNDVFGGTIPETLTRKHAIPLETVFAIEKDDTNNKEATRMLVSEVLGPVFMTASDVRTIWRVCRAVVERAVRLLASAIYA